MKIIEDFIRPISNEKHADSYISSMLYYALKSSPKEEVVATIHLLREYIPKKVEDDMAAESLWDGIFKKTYDKTKVADLLDLKISDVEYYLVLSDQEELHSHS